MENLDFIRIFTPVVVALLTAIAYIVGIAIKRLACKAGKWIEEKRDNETFDAAYKVAEGLYVYLEDEYADKIGSYGKEKMDKMVEMLKERFPTLTEEELLSINKQVWLSFQEGFTGAYEKSLEKGKDGVIPEEETEVILIQDATETTRLDG